MTFFGLHWADALILLAYIVGVLVVGRILSHRVKGENDFFLAGRKLGKWFQFFLNFGNMTDPSQATVVSSSVYSQGAGGVWLGLIPIFMSPAYWFLPVWYRRVRLTTTADLFDDRFGKRFLASFYSIITLSVGILTIGQGNVVAYKTLAPIMVKSPAEYSVPERQRMDEYQEYVRLRHTAALSPAQKVRYGALKDLYARGSLLPYVSHLSPIPFYLISSTLIAIFLVLGGLQASALVDGLQTILTIVISFLLVPFGLARIGGAHGLHERLPAWKFLIFGASNASEYTWYSIAALLLVSIIGTVGATAAMVVNGSARTELAARLGAVTGGVTKRFVTMAWCLSGLIALAMFTNLSDPDQTWGALTSTLLPVGLIGVMIVGILGGKLAYLGANSISNSALIVRNIYRPLFPGRSDRHYMFVARATIPLILLIGALFASCMNSVVAILKLLIVLLVVWGAPIFLMFTWRRLTEMAVRIQMIACLGFIAIVPWIVSVVPALRQAPALTVMTHPAAGSKEAPVSVFFEDAVVHVNPGDLSSPLEGVGRFNIEIYLVSLFGVDATRFNAAGITTTRYVVDSILPFILLIVFSYVTPRTDPERVSRFYARMKTPVAADPQEDAVAVQASYADPARFDHTKLFPRSNWEFTKWNAVDALGFLGTCASVVVILLIFKAVLMYGG